jgi:alpha-L-fucosidase
MYFDQPVDQIAVKGLLTPVAKVTELSTGRELAHRKIGGLGDSPGIVWIDAPLDLTDPNATVLKVEFEEPLEFYTGSGRS